MRNIIESKLHSDDLINWQCIILTRKIVYFINIDNNKAPYDCLRETYQPFIRMIQNLYWFKERDTKWEEANFHDFFEQLLKNFS
jgi:hypothetical protein